MKQKICVWVSWATADSENKYSAMAGGTSCRNQEGFEDLNSLLTYFMNVRAQAPRMETIANPHCSRKGDATNQARLTSARSLQTADDKPSCKICTREPPSYNPVKSQANQQHVFRLRLQTVAGWKHARFSVNALHRQNLCPTRTLQDPNPQGICNGASATLSPLLGKAGRWRPAPARHAIPMATHRPGTHNRLSYSNRARADTEKHSRSNMENIE